MSNRNLQAEIQKFSAIARRAVPARDWATVAKSAREILNRDANSAEGWFLTGLREKAAGRILPAIDAFSKSYRLDWKRYDAAVELADLYLQSMRHGDAVELLQEIEPLLSKSPLYLDRAARVYTRLGLHAEAAPLYAKACELQPGADSLKANLAANSVLTGRLDQARSLYHELLQRHPGHQRNHYELARLERAKDRSHVDQMIAVLEAANQAPAQNIFMYYAIAKELEDLEEWQESFEYYRRGGDAASKVARKAGYDVGMDVAVIERIIEICNDDWLSGATAPSGTVPGNRAPIFIVGLPRTGTTLTERIIASHSQVESADETFFLQIAIGRAGGLAVPGEITPEILSEAAKSDLHSIANEYLEAVEYRLGDRPLFIDKYPFNFLYLGFIARAFPDARIVHLRRHPMDACFAMYKQSFFKFAYTLDDLGRYYVAYDRLSRHWSATLQDRLIEVRYESLVSDFETETRSLLDKLGLEFEPACLEFHQNRAPSATASAAQIREKAHTRSVHKWKKMADQLEPLKQHLEQAGIAID